VSVSVGVWMSVRMRIAANRVLRKRIGGGVAGAGNPLKANIGELRDQTARLRREGA